MTLKRIEAETGEFDSFTRALNEHVGKSPGDFRAGAADSGTVILGNFDGERLRAFAIFQPYRDPTLHLGGMIDPGYLRHLDEMKDVALYNISLIHSLEGDDALADFARELIGGFEEMILEEYEEYCLLISLLKKANRIAMPLYRSLGFKKRGGESYFMELDPLDIVDRYGKAEKEEGGIVVKTFEELDEKDFVGLAACYGKVFASQIDEETVMHNLRSIIARPSFMPGLSVAVTDTSRGEVIGFCFIERGEDKSLYINAAGLIEGFRGGGVSMRSFSWVMENCAQQGWRAASLVTASEKLKSAFEKMICARPKDTLVWFIKCGIRDE